MNTNSSPNIKDSMYSKIIEPEAYNRITSKEHLYISASDRHLVEVIDQKIKNFTNHEVIELGCGPARILPLVGKIENIKLTGIDHDPEFINYAKKIVKDSSIEIIHTDIETYQHHNPVSIFYSQGVHHHIPKGEITSKYLSNIYNQLETNGYYILSDEFIQNYSNENEREKFLVIWYSHIISHAIKDGFNYLAEEEAKTLLDDLQEGHQEFFYKTKEQINLVLSQVNAINKAAEKNNLKDATMLANTLINELRSKQQKGASGDDTLDLSRRDYKICDKVLRTEIEQVGFRIESVKSFGPIKNIGAMSVYILKKI